MLSIIMIDYYIDDPIQCIKYEMWLVTTYNMYSNLMINCTYLLIYTYLS